jgi:hypothetical protein
MTTNPTKPKMKVRGGGSPALKVKKMSVTEAAMMTMDVTCLHLAYESAVVLLPRFPTAPSSAPER